MPVDAIEYGMYTYGFKGKIRLSMGRELLDKDKQFVYSMMNYLGVSKTALLNRLRDLNYVEDIDADQYWENKIGYIVMDNMPEKCSPTDCGRKCFQELCSKKVKWVN